MSILNEKKKNIKILNDILENDNQINKIIKKNVFFNNISTIKKPIKISLINNLKLAKNISTKKTYDFSFQALSLPLILASSFFLTSNYEGISISYSPFWNIENNSLKIILNYYTSVDNVIINLDLYFNPPITAINN